MRNSGFYLIRERIKGLFRHPLFGALTVLGNGSIALAAAAFYQLESQSNPKVDSYLDALWWSVATVTTVGYGDILPQTVAGKFLGIGMMIFGSAIFCSFTALFASVLLRPDLLAVEKELEEVDKLLKEKEDQTKGVE